MTAIRKRRLILLGLVFLGGLVYGATEEIMALRWESAL